MSIATYLRSFALPLSATLLLGASCSKDPGDGTPASAAAATTKDQGKSGRSDDAPGGAGGERRPVVGPERERVRREARAEVEKPERPVPRINP